MFIDDQILKGKKNAASSLTFAYFRDPSVPGDRIRSNIFPIASFDGIINPRSVIPLEAANRWWWSFLDTRVDHLTVH